jgi:hypothetical protein
MVTGKKGARGVPCYLVTSHPSKKFIFVWKNCQLSGSKKADGNIKYGQKFR